MRLGMSEGFLPENMDAMTPEIAARVRAIGYSGIFTRFTDDDPFAVTEARCRRVRELLAVAGIAMFQATGHRPPLVHPDENRRRDAARTLCRALEVAAWLGAASVDTGPGSLSPRGPWMPHPYNYTREAHRQLVKSLREAAGAAEEHGVLLCLEGHQLVTLRSAEVMRDVVDAVGSTWVRVDFDPVNWITLDTVYDSGAAIEAMCDVLGDRIAGAHVKDVVLEDRLVVHLDHCAAGQGMLDIGAQLRCLEALDPEMPVIAEAASADELPDVFAFLSRTAEAEGIVIRS